jgi:uncharacterized cupin superfamily protein
VNGTKKFLRVNAAGPNGCGLAPTTHDASDTPLEGARHPHAYTAYTDPSGVFTVGVWACDAGTLEIRDLALDEACYLIAGEVIISDAHGNSERFIAGEIQCDVQALDTGGRSSRQGEVCECDWW